MSLMVFDNADDLATAASRRIVELITRTPHRFSLGVAGGSTPKATYERLRREEPGWAKVTAWLSDERWVAPDHPRSNGAMAVDALFDHVPAEFLRPGWGESLSALDSAEEYERALRSLHRGDPPDAILLGIGDDGHTASLFPGTRALDERDRWYVANDVPRLGEVRLTATYPLLWSARLLMILVTGASKAEALRTVLDGSLPAGRLAEGDGVVEWYVDREAASLVR